MLEHEKIRLMKLSHSLLPLSITSPDIYTPFETTVHDQKFAASMTKYGKDREVSMFLA